MLRVWRLTSARYADSAFDGEGARLFGGRWNYEGVAVVYTAEHLSLAILEQLVHLRPNRKLAPRVMIPAEIPPKLEVTELAIDEMPDGWRTVEGNDEVKRMGQAWIDRGDSAVLSVPSVVVPRERNLVLNPRHPDFEHIEIGEPHPFEFDPRLLS